MNLNNTPSTTYAPDMEIMSKYTSEYLKGNCPPFFLLMEVNHRMIFYSEWQVLVNFKGFGRKTH